VCCDVFDASYLEWEEFSWSAGQGTARSDVRARDGSTGGLRRRLRRIGVKPISLLHDGLLEIALVVFPHGFAVAEHHQFVTAPITLCRIGCTCTP